MVNLYHPPKVDTNIIVEAVLKSLEMPKVKNRGDLKMSNVSKKYKALFK